MVEEAVELHAEHVQLQVRLDDLRALCMRRTAGKKQNIETTKKNTRTTYIQIYL